MTVRGGYRSAPRRAAKSLLLYLACSASPREAVSQKPSEYEVKAVYLFHFAKFVEWPAEARGASESFTLCVLGEDPFGPILERVLEGETLDGKRPAIRRIQRVQAVEGCRMVFISESERVRLGAILDYLREESLLTVSDLDDFTRRGGMIQFVIDEERVRFEVNLAAASSAGLQFSSELLKVARAVKRDSSRLRGAP